MCWLQVVKMVNVFIWRYFLQFFRIWDGMCQPEVVEGEMNEAASNGTKSLMHISPKCLSQWPSQKIKCYFSFFKYKIRWSCAYMTKDLLTITMSNLIKKKAKLHFPHLVFIWNSLLAFLVWMLSVGITWVRIPCLNHSVVPCNCHNWTKLPRTVLQRDGCFSKLLRSRRHGRSWWNSL